MDDMVVQFEYENERQRQFCEAAAQDILAMGRKTVEMIVKIGERLRQVKEVLPHGRWGPWLDAYFGWTDRTARTYMRVAAIARQNGKVFRFPCVDRVLKFAELPPVSQRAVLDRDAYYRADDFERVAWDAAVRAHLTDEGLDLDRRYGDVLAAIEDARDDPVLAPVARKLYIEYRNEFAKMAEREPEEVDVEVGIDTRPALPTDRPNAQFITAERYWICEQVNGSWVPVVPVQSYVLLWPSASLVAAFPVPQDGPVSASWGAAAADAVCRRLNAKTPAERFAEVAS